MMNTFFHKEGDIFETEEEVKKYCDRFVSKAFDKIETSKDWESFSNDYDEARKECESIADALYAAA